ncbi:hypothetical protein OJAV_G00093590 [Oryzias javanicus]|uniref:CCHC-type domain-containing protein n=1 Tax=Oryzias javanicus TaxID=123683 RepID=A0A3S2UDM4_ORYJA|nr:hypothetical protein OJAV_G00093590 [Oryzias javanicus]
MAMAEWARNSPLCSSLIAFQEALKNTFDPVSTGRDKARELTVIRQGGDSVCDYAIRFRTLAAESGWNSGGANLDSLIALAIRTENRLHDLVTRRSSGSSGGGSSRRAESTERRNPRRFSADPHPSVAADSGEEPMQVGRTRLSAEERQRRLQEGRCFYCGELGHPVFSCPEKRAATVSQISATDGRTWSLTSVMVTHHGSSTALVALIDSGADVSLMDWKLAVGLGLKPRPLDRTIQARGLHGRGLFNITHVSEPLKLSIGNHTEITSFHLFEGSSRKLVLGFPWLCEHNPRVDWATGKIQEWGPGCDGHISSHAAGKRTIIDNNPVPVCPAPGPEAPDRLLDNHLYVKAEKSEFHVSTVTFLGFVVSAGAVKMDPAKVSAVRDWPTPDSRKKLQQFLGFANFYRRFIRGFSSIAAPLHALTSPREQYRWTPAAETAFRTLKRLFTSAPLLTMPDPHRRGPRTSSRMPCLGSSTLHLLPKNPNLSFH